MQGARAFRKASSGVVAVELAVVMPLLLGLILLVLQIGISYYFTTLVQASAYALAREIQSGALPPASKEDAIAIVTSSPGMGAQDPVVVVEPLNNALSRSDPPTSSDFSAPVTGAVSAVTVVVPRPQFLPIGALSQVFPMLFDANITFTVVAMPASNS